MHDMLLHIWLSLLHRNDWILSTVLYRFRLKGHAVRLYTSPQSFSAKIVQVLCHFFNTEETKKKDGRGKNEYMKLVFTVMEPNIELRNDKSRVNTAHWHCVTHKVHVQGTWWPVHFGQESTSFSAQVRSEETRLSQSVQNSSATSYETGGSQ